ncbi:MAG: tRNA epoxyqueuosine(34) reductase QueG, partial [Micropepsaceae bacterium]
MQSSTSNSSALKDAIRARAKEKGFDSVGFAKPRLPLNAADDLEQFLDQGLHGDMAWMAANAERRADPKQLWDAARSVITLGVNYAPKHDPMEALNSRGHGTISVYAQGADYHDVLKRNLKRVASWIAAAHSAEVKIFVDTAPIMEKPIAHASGIGWQGKHTNLVSREFGSWLFLGSIFTTLELEPDQPEEDHCGNCRDCLDICPTKAFQAPYRLDARRCISYLTIEHKGHIATEFREPIGNRIYGCDDCLSVCPWNKFAQDAKEISFAPRPELTHPKLSDLAMLDDAAFRTLFRRSPVKRIGRDRFVRNVLIAIGNSQDGALAKCAEELLTDDSPLVRAMAVWAL